MDQSKRTPAVTRHLNGALRWVMLSALMAISATVAISAWAQPMHRGGGMMFGGSPEHVARGVDRMLDGLNATDAQRTQIKQIAQAAADDLKTQRESTRALRAQSLQIFAAPTVDAAAAESVRQQLGVKHDEASRRMLQAMLDVSRVLTPEQRAKMAERLQQGAARRGEPGKAAEGRAPR